VSGTATNGAGLLGTSESGNYFDAGVDGESSNSTGNDAGGVFGATFLANGIAPYFGAVGFGAKYGLFGQVEFAGTQSANGFGVIGQDNIGTAPSGDANVGVLGQSTYGTGVLGASNASPQISVYGESPVGVYAVAHTGGTPNGNAFAFFGETDSFGIDIHSTNSANSVYVLSPGSLFQGYGSTGNVTISTAGNETLSGTLTTSKGTYVRTTGASGTAMMEYSQRTTAPEVEDVGEGQLANGRAYVNIDARLGDTIDRRTAYHVFVTPEGDCNGLYVTQKTAAGFAVRELRGGRSSLAFEYRIVAKPLDENGARLAIAPALAKPFDDGMKTGRSARRPQPLALSPQEQLKRRIGTEAYAREMLEFRARRQGIAH
jgi:hypothetical protein